MECYYSGCNGDGEYVLANEAYCRYHYLEIMDTFQTVISGRKAVTANRILTFLRAEKATVFHISLVTDGLKISYVTVNKHLKRLASLRFMQKVDENGFWRLLE